MTLTHDFLGSYDWPAEEARGVANYYLETLDDCDDIAKSIERERPHWLKVFGDDPQGRADFARFCEVFNKLAAEKIGVSI